ncbi:MAG: hypothetical protein JHD23_06535, partial [Akkermansiaceae bacterium]|nr:hypothetical protein [Akkermansiaceae bacterium]
RRRNFISRTGIRSDGYLLKRTKSADLRTALLDVMNGGATDDQRDRMARGWLIPL